MQSNKLLGFFCKIDTFVTDKERHKTEQRQQQRERNAVRGENLSWALVH